MDALMALDEAGYTNLAGLKGGYYAWFGVFDHKLNRSAQCHCSLAVGCMVAKTCSVIGSLEQKPAAPDSIRFVGTGCDR